MATYYIVSANGDDLFSKAVAKFRGSEDLFQLMGSQTRTSELCFYVRQIVNVDRAAVAIDECLLFVVSRSSDNKKFTLTQVSLVTSFNSRVVLIFLTFVSCCVRRTSKNGHRRRHCLDSVSAKQGTQIVCCKLLVNAFHFPRP